ncbi:MAG TPA: magnesium transporter [Gemmataceae bacterium]|nr:magnesium transporter [Gemmataceae bacterium]
MSHPLFTPEARLLLEKDDLAAMEAFCETLHPATVAESLSSDAISVEDAWRFLNTTTIANQAAIFVYFPLEAQVQLVEGTGRPHMARLIEQMSHDDRADLLRRLEPKVVESLLRLVDEADRRDIATLVKYPENTAGALMTTDYAWLPANILVDQALDRLRLQAPDSETIYYVYVVDDQRKLLGVVTLRELILAPRKAAVSDLMDAQPVTVKVYDDRERVAQEMTRLDLLAIPVIDTENRLVGIVTYDDVIDVVVSEATEDVHRMGAVAPLEESYLETSFVKLWWKRAGWLALLFVAELFTFSALSSYEDAIAAVVVLSLFVPLCISTGGNSGSQAATLITRAMALGQVSPRDWHRVLRHEILMGMVLGITLGIIGYGRAALTPESVLSSSPPRAEHFYVPVSKNAPLQEGTISEGWFWGKKTIRVIKIPEELPQVMNNEDETIVALPEDGMVKKVPDPNDPQCLLWKFPANCKVFRPAVERYRLALVIALAVAAICLWGTLVGSMLPLFFRRIGIDPGIASSPFVATFVDVTGIVIYFSIAKYILGQYLA